MHLLDAVWNLSAKDQCARCGFGTNIKHVLKNHIVKTKPCDFNISDLNKDELMESYIKLTQKSTKFKCEQCHKCYASKITLDKHKISYCKVNKLTTLI